MSGVVVAGVKPVGHILGVGIGIGVGIDSPAAYSMGVRSTHKSFPGRISCFLSIPIPIPTPMAIDSRRYAGTRVRR